MLDAESTHACPISTHMPARNQAIAMLAVRHIGTQARLCVGAPVGCVAQSGEKREGGGEW
jgi:hypothetical protein